MINDIYCIDLEEVLVVKTSFDIAWNGSERRVCKPFDKMYMLQCVLQIRFIMVLDLGDGVFWSSLIHV